MIRRLVVWVREHPNPVAVWGVVLVSVVVLAGMSYVIRGNRHNAAAAKALAVQGKEAHDALCVFKADLAARTAASRAFVEHPPREIFGIKVTPALIAQAQTSATNQQATLDSLGGLDCRLPSDS